MNWLASNWIWLALGIGALTLFAFGRGGCGMGHGSRGQRGRGGGNQADPRREATFMAPLVPAPGAGADEATVPSTGHVHGASSSYQGGVPAEHTGHENGSGQTAVREHRHGC